jgi:hypothetical protein
MYVGRDFDVAEPEEDQTFGFDFINDIAEGDVVVGATWTIEDQAAIGTDLTALKDGTPSYGTTVTHQRFKNLVDGKTYILTAKVTTQNGDVVQLHSHVKGVKRS